MINECEIETSWSRRKRARIAGRFLRGPVPLSDIAAASRLPGQALGVYLAIHHRAAMTGSDLVTLPKGLLEQFGVSRDSKARALQALEGADLVAVERPKGRAARITLRSSAQPTSTGG
jgi:hypothetical protein